MPRFLETITKRIELAFTEMWATMSEQEDGEFSFQHIKFELPKNIQIEMSSRKSNM